MPPVRRRIRKIRRKSLRGKQNGRSNRSRVGVGPFADAIFDYLLRRERTSFSRKASDVVVDAGLGVGVDFWEVESSRGVDGGCWETLCDVGSVGVTFGAW